MKYCLGPYVLDNGVWVPPDGAIASIDMRSLPAHALPGCGFFAFPDDATPSNDYRQFGPTGYLTDVIPQESDRAVFASMVNAATVDGDRLIDWLASALTIYADPLGETGVMPLMPTNRNLEIHLAGHSKVWTRPFKLDMPEAVPVIKVLHENYAQVRRDSKDGLFGNVKGAPDEEFYLKVLDMWGDQFGIIKPQDIFIPDDLPKEEPRKHDTTLTETFDGADGTLGFNYTWTALDGTTEYQNLGTSVRFSGAADVCRTRMQADVTGNNSTSQVFTGSVSDTAQGYFGTIGRCNASNDNSYWFAAGVPDQLTSITKQVSSTPTLLSSGTATATLSHGTAYTVRGSCNGSTIKLYINTVEQLSVTDTAIATGTRGGLYAQKGTNGIYYDNYVIADIATTAFPANYYAQQ